MVVVLFVLALAMVVLGLSAVAFGMSIIQVERGWTMVIAGTVAASAGVIVLGVAVLAHRLGRIVTEMSWVRDRLATIGELTTEASYPQDTEAVEVDPNADYPQHQVDAAPGPAVQTMPPPGAGRVLVGQHSSGGNQYQMYSDGSIDATTPAGLRRFNSLEELRAFVAGGGERGG